VGLENRQRLGSKMDGIIRSWHHTNYYELGAIESGKESAAPTTTKWLYDGLKLKRALGDMLLDLHDRVADEAVGHVQTVGILTSGFKAQMVRCWAPQGGWAIICDTVGPVHEFPRDVETLNRDLWPLIAMVDMAVTMVADTLAVVKRGRL
jgi:hypothetical protein